MKSYQVVFLTNNNNTYKNRLFSQSKNDLIDLLSSVGIHDDDIISVTYEPYFGNYHLSIEKQMLILIRLSSVISSGDIKLFLHEIVSEVKEKQYILNYLIDSNADLETIFLFLDFNVNIIELIKTAKNTGQSENSIVLAIKIIRRRN